MTLCSICGVPGCNSRHPYSVFYSVIDAGEAIILRDGDVLEGAGVYYYDKLRWSLLSPSDSVWIVPGTVED